MKRCFIYAAGTFYGLREPPRGGDLQIAADAGLHLCERLGVRPDVVLGDFDSMDVRQAPADCIRVPVEKDDTDTMLALREGLRRGCDTFYLYGATGGARLDHTLANLQSLAFLLRHRARGYLYDRDFVYTVIENETLALEREVDWGIVSLFSMGDRAEHITLESLSRLACVNKTTLCRAFKSIISMSPIAYVGFRRIEVARELLTGTSKSVGEIAAAVGYQNIFHFSRQFREAQGKSPTEYRRTASQ